MLFEKSKLNQKLYNPFYSGSFAGFSDIKFRRQSNIAFLNTFIEIARVHNGCIVVQSVFSHFFNHRLVVLTMTAPEKTCTPSNMLQ